MLGERLLRAVAVCLILIVPAISVAQAQGGMLVATGNVTVNGKAVGADVNTAVLPGDKIQTGAGAAQLKLEGSLLQLGRDTEVVVGAVPEFGCGQMSYFSFRSIPVRVGPVQVKPTSGETKFDLVHADGAIAVAVTMGSVLVAHNDQATTLRAGDSTTVADNANCPVYAGSAAPAAAQTHRNGKLVALLAGAGAGGAVAVVMATRQKEPVSPSRP